MNYFSRFLRALPPVCAVLVAGAAVLGSGHSAFAKTPSFSSATPSRASLPSLSRDAFVRVGVAAAPIESATDLTKIGGFSNLLGSTGPSASGFRLVQATQNIEISFQNPTVQVTEGTPNVVLTVTRTGNTSVQTTVNFTTANGAATEPQDYAKSSGFVTFARGIESRTITIPIVDDNIVEAPESFTIALSGPVNTPATTGTTTITNGTATIQINDNDTAIQLDLAAVAVNEADGTARIDIIRDTATTGAQVDYTITNGTATNGEDFSAAASGTATFGRGETRTTILIPITNDSVDELDENFTVTLTAARTQAGTGTGANILGTNVTTDVTIQDNDDTFVGLTATTAQVDEGDGAYTLTVTRPFSATNDISRAITVNYQTVTIPGQAQTPQDYTTTNGTLTFEANERTKTIEIPIIDDNLAENTETFRVQLSGADFVTRPEAGINVVINPVAAITISILDNDPQVNFNASSYTVAESVGTFLVPVTRKFNLGVEATIQYTTSNGSAIGGQDYVTTTGTLTFGPGETTKNIPLPIINDESDENQEDFQITLSNPSSTTSRGPQFFTTINITDNDDIPSLTVANVSQKEGDNGQTILSFVATLSAPSGRNITLNYRTADGSATDGNPATEDRDYEGQPNGSVRFDVDQAQGLGPKTRNIDIVINGDTKFEGNPADAPGVRSESFILNLLSINNATLVTRTATGTILDDDAIPSSTFKFAPVSYSIAENDPTGLAKVTITREGDLSNAATVTLNTVDGTAIGGADYTPVSTIVSFPANTTSQTINIPIQNESVNEADETFQAVLSSPTTSVGTATLEDATATVTIVNDDAAPTLTIAPVSVLEGNSGTTELIFRALVTGSSEQTLSVQYATEDGTATVADNDYEATSGTLTFEPGDTERMIIVTVNGDEKMPIEQDETFSLVLTNPQNLTLSSSRITGTIRNDDTPPTFSNLAFVRTAIAVNEAAGRAIIAVRRTTGADRVATIRYATANGTAAAGADYTATSGTLTFPVGVTTANIEVPIINDTLQEPGAAETFTVTLSNPGGNGVQPSARTATVSITDNEGAPALSIASAEVLEGNAGRIALPFTVSLFPQSKSTVRVNVATVQRTGAGAATSGQDYVARTGTLTFAPGQATQTFIVYVVGNNIVEDDETFNVQLSAPQGAPIAAGKSVAVGTIINDDEPGGGGTISFLSASYAVNENVQDETITPSRAVRITLGRDGRLDNINAQSATVRFTTGIGTATANQDYRPVNQIVTFPAGATMASVIIPILDDIIFENDETVPLTLSSPSDNAILGSQTTALLTITDNDPRSLTPRADAITPSNLSGSVFVVKSVYSTDSEDGVNDLSPVLLQFGGNVNGGGFRAIYDPRTNLLSINPTTGQSLSPGARGILSNQFGALDASKTSVVRSGNTLTVTWRLALTSKVALYVYSGATSASSGQSVFIRRGIWQPATTTTSSTKGS